MDSLKGIDLNIVKVMIACLLCVFVGMSLRGETTKANGKVPNPPFMEKVGDLVGYLGMAFGFVMWFVIYQDSWHPELVRMPYAIPLWLAVIGLAILQPLGVPWLVSRAIPYDPVNIELESRVRNTRAFKIQMYVTGAVAAVSFVQVWLWTGRTIGLTDGLDHVTNTVVIVTFAVFGPAFGMHRIVPKHWRELLDVADEVEIKRRERLAEMAVIEALAAETMVLMSLPVLHNSLEKNEAVADVAAQLMGAVLIRVNECMRTMGNIIGLMLRNKNIRVETQSDKEVYEHLHKAFKVIRNVGQLTGDQPVVDVTPPGVQTPTTQDMWNMPTSPSTWGSQRRVAETSGITTDMMQALPPEVRAYLERNKERIRDY